MKMRLGNQMGVAQMMVQTIWPGGARSAQQRTHMHSRRVRGRGAIGSLYNVLS